MATILLLLITACEKLPLFDYRNEFVGLYNCRKVESTTHPTINAGDTTETYIEHQIVSISKVEGTKDELYFAGLRIKVDKNGYGLTNHNTGASYVSETYTVTFSENSVTLVRIKNAVNFSIETTYTGEKF